MKLTKSWKKLYKRISKEPLTFFKIVLEIVLVYILIAFFSYKQTEISERLLEIQEKETLIFEYEHSPKFKLIEFSSKKDSLNNCITEGIQIQNEGYEINNISIKIFSFFDVQIPEKSKTIFPVELYYRIGIGSQNSKGVLESYTGTWNCKNFYEFRNEFYKKSQTYSWDIKKYHIVQITWTDVLKKNHTDYFITNKLQPSQKISHKKALRLIKLHKYNYKINMQEKINVEEIIKHITNKTYNKFGNN